MIAPNINFSPVRVTFCSPVPQHDRNDDPGKQRDPEHQQEENADPEPLAVHALDTEVEPRTRPAEPQDHHAINYPLICGSFFS